MNYTYFSIRTLRALLLAGSLALAAGLTAPLANAGDFPKPPSPFDWSGFYIGGNVGAAWSNYDIGSHDAKVDVGHQLFLFEGPGPLASDVQTQGAVMMGFGPDLFFENGGGGGGTDLSLTGGGQVGYQFVWNHFVFGVEGGFNGVGSSSDMPKSQGVGEVFFDGGGAPREPINGFVDSAETTETSRREADTRWAGSAVGRLGYATGPFLFYGLGGVSFAGVTVHAQDTARSDFFGGGDVGNQVGRFLGSRTDQFQGSDDNVLVGYTAGGGAEYALTQICSVGVEYRHNGFGSHEFHFASKQGPVYPGNTSVNVDSDQVTLRVNFWLGHAGH